MIPEWTSTPGAGRLLPRAVLIRAVLIRAVLIRAVLIRAVLIAAGGLLLAAAPFSPDLARVLESLGLPYADSNDFDIDTRLTIATPGYDDSFPFPVDTRLATFTPQFAESLPFDLDTSLPRPDPSFASTAFFDLDTRGINRVWGDSATFTYDNPTGCVGPYGGTYSGASAGTLEAYFDCNNTISFTFISYFGTVDFQSVVTVEPDGTVFGSFAGATLNGTFDFDGCTASGTWAYSGYSGAWNLARIEPGACIAPAWLLTPQAVSREAAGGLFGVAVTLRAPTAWSASVTAGEDWLRLTSPLPAAGTASAILWAEFDENPNPGPRSGTIRVSAPAANPTYRDVTLTQAGSEPTAQVTHFEFDPIPGPYMVNERIPVTITAHDGNNQMVETYSGRVYLSATKSTIVSKNYVDIVGGMWSDHLSFTSAATSVALVARTAQGQQAVSETFDVTAPASTPGWITGHVTTGNPPSPARGIYVLVQRRRDDHPLVPVQQTDEDGRYTYELPPGDYLISPSDAVNRPVRVIAGRTAIENMHANWGRQRVLLVGGILGSTMKIAPRNWYPQLGRTPSAADLVLYDPECPRRLAFGRDVDVWRSLRSALSDSFDLVPVPWNWRLPVDEAWREYLKPAIDNVKRSPTDKVHIVAHSMGGLLARAYIQSDDYGEDVDKLALLGTPSEGAPIAYYVWEGGDLAGADTIQNSTAAWACGLNDFYSETAKLAALDLQGYQPPDQAGWLTFIRAQVSGLGDLMATYPFINDGGVLLRQWSGASGSVLSALNAGHQPYAHPERLVGESGSPLAVRTKLFFSASEKTLVNVLVGAPGGDGLFPQGVPESPQSDGLQELGDGTVPKSSVLADLGLPRVEQSQEGSHAELMKANRAEICEFLTGQPCAVAQELLLQGGLANVLDISVAGDATVLFIDPDQRAAGVDPFTGELVDEIPGAQLVSAGSGGALKLNDANPGTYRLEIKCVGEGIIIARAAYSNDADSETVQASAHCVKGGSVHALLVNAETLARVTLVADVEGPTSIRTDPADGLTRVLWDASPDPSVSAYKVYARPDDEPKYTLLGTTSDTHFDTGHPWSVAGSAPTWHYFVTAVATDGTESFFTETVENRHPLVARFSADVTDGVEPLPVAFADESGGEAVAWNWDFESDGVIDSTVQNAVHRYATAGSYTVTLTVGGPEGTDTTIRPGFIIVDPLVPPPPPVPGDFDGDSVVGLADYAALVERMTGPFADPTLAGWHIFDLDPDYDVDLRDFAIWGNRFGERGGATGGAIRVRSPRVRDGSMIRRSPGGGP
jgi:hypothetical protein